MAGDPTSIALADVTGDGKLDIITGDAIGDDLSLLVGLGNGTFLPAVSLQSASTPYSSPSPTITATAGSTSPRPTISRATSRCSWVPAAGHSPPPCPSPARRRLQW